MIVENHMIHPLKNTTFLVAKSYEITFCVWNFGIVYVLDLFLNSNTKSSKNNIAFLYSCNSKKTVTWPWTFHTRPPAWLQENSCRLESPVSNISSILDLWAWIPNPWEQIAFRHRLANCWCSGNLLDILVALEKTSMGTERSILKFSTLGLRAQFVRLRRFRRFYNTRHCHLSCTPAKCTFSNTARKVFLIKKE